MGGGRRAAVVAAGLPAGSVWAPGSGPGRRAGSAAGRRLKVRQAAGRARSASGALGFGRAAPAPGSGTRGTERREVRGSRCAAEASAA